MKTKQSKTNTHLSRTSLLSDEGPVSLPEDLSIPTAQKEDRQGMHCLPEPQAVGERKRRHGIQPKKQDQRPPPTWMVEVWAPNFTGGLTPFRPLSWVQEIPGATREESGVLCFPGDEA